MREIAHAAIDAGADIVIGHGPHYSLPVEVYRGKPIFYGLGSFSFHTGHGGRQHGDWIGMMARARFDGSRLAEAGFRFVRHNQRNETVPCALTAEQAEFEDIRQRSEAFGTRLNAGGDEVRVDLG
jgi:poly-gamma-glutamate synthesis protein (capsule biosynthesis protein)